MVLFKLGHLHRWKKTLLTADKSLWEVIFIRMLINTLKTYIYISHHAEFYFKVFGNSH